MIRFLTAGESHGPALTAIIEGFPAGIPLTKALLQKDLDRRRRGYGRGGRMKIEGDQVKIVSGVRHGETIGSPITLQIGNRDWERWKDVMSPDEAPQHALTSDPTNGEDPLVTIAGDERLTELHAKVTKARPGHADLAGALKYQQQDIRNILERASARETAARVAVGASARCLLQVFGISVFSGVIRIGSVAVTEAAIDAVQYRKNVEASPVATPDPSAEAKMMAEIDQAKENGDSLGGMIEVLVKGVPPGLGSHVHWERRLDARLSGALMSIPAIKAVGIGLGFEAAALPGSRVHDPIFYHENRGFYRETNFAGGIEGGMSNGEMIRLVLAMKPIPTLYKPLQSVDLESKAPVTASIERSDVCAVPAAAVVAEAMTSWILAEAFLEKFGGDHLDETRANYRNYCEILRSRQ